MFGFCNSLDMNPLKKYRSVWMPPELRSSWQIGVQEVAERADLIVINATRPGNGLSYELRTIPCLFPQRTWLIVARAENGAVLPDAVETAERLSKLSEHLSYADLTDGMVHDAWPLFPTWIKQIIRTRRQS
jgi:hypothetical protein